MRIKLNYFTTLVAVGAAAVAIAAAPIAAAATVNDPGAGQLSCSYTGGGFQDNQCQTPGNAQLNDSLPPVLPTPQYFGGDGDSYGGYGFHGGGHR
jgi:hypothetical protein